MPLTNQAIAQVLEQYLEVFPDERDDMHELSSLLAGDASAISRKNFVGHVTASGLVLRGNEIILIQHNTLHRLMQPGGHVEDDDTLWQSARREVMEELGVSDASLHPWHAQHGYIPLHIDTHPIPANEKKNEPAHVHHDFSFVFNWIDGPIALQTEEVSAFVWVPLDHVLETALLREAIVKIRRLIRS